LTRRTPSGFPELQRVFSGYLHEDVLAEYGSPEAALRAYRTDAAPAEMRRFRKEVKRFLAQSRTLDFDEVRALLHQLGSRWIPQSPEALIALLTDAAS
jgi:CdiI immunity protein